MGIPTTITTRFGNPDIYVREFELDREFDDGGYLMVTAAVDLCSEGLDEDGGPTSMTVEAYVMSATYWANGTDDEAFTTVDSLEHLTTLTGLTSEVVGQWVYNTYTDRCADADEDAYLNRMERGHGW